MWLTFLKSFKLLLNPTVLLVILGAFAAGGLTGYWRGVNNTANKIEATEARLEQERQNTYDAAMAATADAIARIKIVNTTIRQELEREVRTEKVYAECRHSDDTLRLLNAILKGEAPAESLDSGELPAAGPVN